MSYNYFTVSASQQRGGLWAGLFSKVSQGVNLMIISASYKTDIPAFYGKWFMNRLRAGYCKVLDSYGKKIYRADLRPEMVDGFVFWTKNIHPFLQELPTIREMGYPFYVQYTINNYPRALESAVIDADKAIDGARQIALQFGSNAVVWRYDTIIFSSITRPEYHLSNFQNLCQKMSGIVNEVVVSFAQTYQKTTRNMNLAAQEFNFTWEDPDNETKLQLTKTLAGIAAGYNIQLTVCAQPEYIVPGVQEAHCIDIHRLSSIAGRQIFAELKGSRAKCACYMSRDIGEYDTCPHGCVYCYAVENQQSALEKFKRHNPESEFLLEPAQDIPYEEVEQPD